MTRLIRKEDREPMEVKVGNESKWICMCGLSNNQPFCDGSHKKTADEEAGKVYRYSSDGTRTEIQYKMIMVEVMERVEEFLS
jgi:CDGSH iron-sulfur domain-containing protein 3